MTIKLIIDFSLHSEKEFHVIWLKQIFDTGAIVLTENCWNNYMLINWVKYNLSFKNRVLDLRP